MAEPENKFSLPALEEKILKFWEENKIFEKSLEKNKKGKAFIFYEGPPTANGKPGVHHAEARSFKDIILRYKTMRGFFVPRKAGWDTHGLPVEIEVEKQLGLKSKRDIEKYGIARFNEKAKESVWRYKDEWEKATKRLGFWLDMEHPYITYDTVYIETIWWIIKEIWKRGLLYEGFKVVPWCPRCETGLSSHEVGLGYKKIREDSIYVKLKIKGRKNEYLLIWTTTPWTLPANVAVALNPKVEYTKFKIGDEYVWSANTPPYGSEVKVSVAEKAAGRSLLGLRYESLFSHRKEHSLGKEPEFITVAGEFVSTEEGTGMVHLAPAFGEDDLETARKHGGDSYPILHTVEPGGKMKKGVIGEGKFVKDADKIIIEDLTRRGLLYKIVSHEHDYPFCWRCQTPLLYFAKTSWWIRMSALREKLLKNNRTVNWIPKHIKDGRFGEFLREVRDWAFSRERYWGTPLPVWRCGKCKAVDLVGSREELSERTGKQKNFYLVMRHGEAFSNVKGIVNYKKSRGLGLTLRGKLQVERAVKVLKRRKIDLVFASDIQRTKETADLVGRSLGIKVYTDSRLREINTGILEGRSPGEYHKYFSSRMEKFVKSPPGGETLTELRRRVFEFLEDIEKKYSGKRILIVSHEYPLWMLYSAARGLTNQEAVSFKEERPKEDFIGFAEVMELPIKRLSRDENKEVNLHRPYIDSIRLSCRKCGGDMIRVPEVADVWFDSGAMPFAQYHWPFVSKIKLPFPGDYICEAVDQTRGWFYTLLAVATLLGKGAPYKNVISLGHVLDKNGQKMSKSKGNAIDPDEMIQKYGADALRWYFYTINSPGEPKRFDERDLFNQLRNFLGTLWNSFLFFDTYVEKIAPNKKVRSGGALDLWIRVKLNDLVSSVTKSLDGYDITSAARAIEDFTIRDFSQWYLRRSRRRFQHPKTGVEKKESAVTTAEVLLSLCRLAAPFVPFLSEVIYQESRRKMKLIDPSVHLSSWPLAKATSSEKSFKILKDMQVVREVVAEAMKLRADAGIKVRQPLPELRIKNKELRNEKELLSLIKDEVNVKTITFGEDLKLDIVITPELKEEGLVREVVRNVQEMRRDLGLKPNSSILLQVDCGAVFYKTLEKWRAFIKKEVNARQIKMGGKKVFQIERELALEGASLWIGVSL